MSSTMLTTIIIVLAEILLVVAVAGVFLYLRSQKRKTRKADKPVTTPEVDDTPHHEAEDEQRAPSLLDYLQTEIDRTSSRIEAIDPKENATEQDRLDVRLNLLNAEKRVLDTIGANNDSTDYWAVINSCYENEADESSDGTSVDNDGKRDAIYLARIKNLEKFKSMFLNSQEQLKDSFDTINELKEALSNFSSSDEAAQLEDMVDKLSIDNIKSNKELTNAQQQLQSVLEELDDVRITDEDPAQAEIVEGENKGSSALDYIEAEIQRTRARLEQIDGTQDAAQQASLNARLKLLDTEKQLLEAAPDEEADYWTTIDQHYKQEPEAGNNDDKTDSRDAIYLARIQNLENFKQMFMQSQDQLKESFDTINNLKSALGNIGSSEEADQLEDMVDLLSIDNINLNKQLTEAQRRLEKLVDEIDTLREKLNTAEPTLDELSADMIDELSTENIELSKQLNDTKHQLQTMIDAQSAQKQDAAGGDKINEQIVLLKEENEFLTTQIEYLLKQESESSEQMQSQMQRMETALQEKEGTQEQASQHEDSAELTDKLDTLKEENEFLTTQIEYLLKQEVENSEQMKEQITELQAALEEKERQFQQYMQADQAQVENATELDTELQTIKEENQFLCDQIQHLLQQELESSALMKAQMQRLESELHDKQTESETLSDTGSD